MGVLELFSTLTKNEVVSNAIKKNFKDRMVIKHFFIDLNSILHVSMQQILSRINTLIKHVASGEMIHQDMIKKNSIIKAEEIKKMIEKTKEIPKQIQIINHFYDDIKLDKMITILAINKICNMIGTYCDKSLETIMIAIDGVPSKSKMMEQRARKYSGAIMEAYKRKLFEDHTEYLKDLDNNDYYVTKYEVKWDRLKISPGTKFLHEFSIYLKDKRIQDKILGNSSKAKIVVSDVHQVGEGEKKIINYINKKVNMKDGKIVVYSPDADMIFLCLLLHHQQVHMLRHDQQASTLDEAVYDLINFDVFKKNMTEYLDEDLNDKQKVANDITFLGVFFGDDFVPKIETFNVKTGFQYLLMYYQEQRKVHQDFLIQKKNGKYSVNAPLLTGILKSLLDNENDFVDNNDFYNEFMSAAQIKYAFPENEVNLQTAPQIVKEFHEQYGKLKMALTNNSDLKEFLNDKSFMLSLQRALGLENMTSKEAIKVLKNKKNYPGPNFNLNSKSTSIKDKFHTRNIDLKTANKYQIEVYKFEKMLDEYRGKFNAEPLDLSRGMLKKYYANNFHDPKEKVVEVYVEGLMWVFEYYYNDDSYLNTWYYPYERAPLLTDVHKYLSKMGSNDLQKISKGLEKYQVVNLNGYLNGIEHLIYCTPRTDSLRKLLPDTYSNFLEKNVHVVPRPFYLDLQVYVAKLYNDPKSNLVDCRSIPYLNKCIFSIIEKPSKSDDDKFIAFIRKVKVDSKVAAISEIRDVTF